MDKFAIIYKLDGFDLHDHFDGYIFEGTLSGAIDDATCNNRHLDYGRNGVQIFKITETLFEMLGKANASITSETSIEL